MNPNFVLLSLNMSLPLRLLLFHFDTLLSIHRQQLRTLAEN